MKKIAHISDLHFGTEDKKIAEVLLTDIKEAQPDVVVVSGDLTQRARTKQFEAAKDYLAKLPFPKIIVPGNHDIPLFDVFRRFLAPLKRYKKIITEDMAPLYNDGELAIYGINTARSLTWKEGRISVEQMKDMETKLCSIPNEVFKVVVTHHPFIPPPDDDGIRLVGRSEKALEIIDKCYIDLLLAGHLHVQYSGDVQPYYPKAVGSTIVAQAGTAISQRVREEPNAYNLIYVNETNIDINVRVWDGNRFNGEETTSYDKTEGGWIAEKKIEDPEKH